MVLQAIRYTRGSLQILDQLQLPHKEVYQDIQTSEEAWRAIKEMRVRGAPAIAIVAALALAVEISSDEVYEGLSADETRSRIVDRLRYLVTSRPTAVNLGDAAKKLESVVDAATLRASKPLEVRTRYIEAAEQMLIDDVQDNEDIGQHGSEWILKLPGVGQSVSVLTHCNTGYDVEQSVSSYLYASN